MNPAERLLGIYDKLISQQNDHNMTRTWAVVFELDENDPHLEDKVTTCIFALRKQIDFTSARLSELGVSADLTNPGFQRFKDIASPGHINASWNGLRGNIQPPECRQAFMWSSWVLRNLKEKDISPEDLNELLDEIAKLEESIAEIEMSNILRDFIQEQIDSIKAALIISGIQGTRPIHDAVVKFAGAYTISRKNIDAEVNQSSTETQGIFSRLGRILKKTAEAGDAVDKLKTLAENVGAGYEAAKPLLLQLFT